MKIRQRMKKSIDEEKITKYGVKRTEPLRGSRRFLDSLSRIPFGNPATNVNKLTVIANRLWWISFGYLSISVIMALRNKFSQKYTDRKEKWDNIGE